MPAAPEPSMYPFSTTRPLSVAAAERETTRRLLPVPMRRRTTASGFASLPRRVMALAIERVTGSSYTLSARRIVSSAAEVATAFVRSSKVETSKTAACAAAEAKSTESRTAPGKRNVFSIGRFLPTPSALAAGLILFPRPGTRAPCKPLFQNASIILVSPGYCKEKQRQCPRSRAAASTTRCRPSRRGRARQRRGRRGALPIPWVRLRRACRRCGRVRSFRGSRPAGRNGGRRI